MGCQVCGTSTLNKALVIIFALARKLVSQDQSLHPFTPYNYTPASSYSTHRRPLISHMTPSDAAPIKSTKLLAPSWHAEDASRQLESHMPNRRSRWNHNVMTADFTARQSFASTSRRDGARTVEGRHSRGLDSENLTKAYIGPNMDLRVTGGDHDSDVERLPPVRIIG
jgi:hypothetical protein